MGPDVTTNQKNEIFFNYFYYSAVFWNEEPEPELRLIESPRPPPVKFISHVPDDGIEDIQLLEHITITVCSTRSGNQENH